MCHHYPAVSMNTTDNGMSQTGKHMSLMITTSKSYELLTEYFS